MRFSVAKKYRNNFIFFCKSYIKDFDRVEKLVASYSEHNIDNIKLIISVPVSDVAEFNKFENGNIKVIADEEYARDHLTNNQYWGLSSGYVNQEICKLAFWESNYSKFYFCIDSDAVFLRDFSLKDFFHSKDVPYQVLVMDKDLSAQSYYHEFAKWRIGKLRKIYRFIGMDTDYIVTCHGMTTISSDVMNDLYLKLLKINKMSYEDLIKISPYEFTWYNAWLQKTKVIKFKASEPIFKTFHTIEEFKIAKASLLTEKLIKEQYVGLVLNSNWYNEKKLGHMTKLGHNELTLYARIMEL